jgi:hypothetical protein
MTGWGDDEDVVPNKWVEDEPHQHQHQHQQQQHEEFEVGMTAGCMG